jgi:hypothetical protein
LANSRSPNDWPVMKLTIYSKRKELRHVVFKEIDSILSLKHLIKMDVRRRVSQVIYSSQAFLSETSYGGILDFQYETNH